MPTIDLSYPKLLDLFQEHLDPSRTESASFLIWYLENYLRLEPVEAVDAVWDQSGDKGVDGIYINEDANTIATHKTIGSVLERPCTPCLSMYTHVYQ